MRKTCMSLAIATAGLVAAAGPAQADPPPTVTQNFVLEGTATAGQNGYCPFDVQVDIVSHQRTTTTTLQDGTVVQRFTGNATATVTNPATGESITYNISGPGTLTTFPDGSFTIDAAGPNLLYTTVENTQPAGVLPLAYTTGRVQVEVDEEGQTTSYRLNGNSTDVCAELAA
jgi:hypothetical protein